MDIEQLAKSMDKDYTWEDKSISRAEHTLPQEPVIEEQEKDKSETKDKGLRIDVKSPADKRLSAMSIEEDQFVDALTSPVIDKTKDSGEFSRGEGD